MRRANVFTTEPEYEDDDPQGYRGAAARLGRELILEGTATLRV